VRVALTKNTLAVPPTYFAVQHALALSVNHDFRFFAAAAEVGDRDLRDRIDIFDATRRLADIGLTWSHRARIAPLLGRQVSRAIRRWRPDVVHQHFANLSGAAVDAATRLDAPLVLTVHGADVYLPLLSAGTVGLTRRVVLRAHQRIVRRAFARANRILAVSDYLADVAIEAGAPASKVEVHYQGVDTDFYRPGVREPAGPPRVVSVSALREAKGTRDLMEASIALAASHPHRLVLVGDGPLRALVEAVAREHDHIEARGQLDREGVRAQLAEATVLALPTKSDGPRREAAGLVLLEAQACGVPVVAYDSGGAREMLANGATGVLVEEGDVRGLAAALAQTLALSVADRRALGTRAREWVVAHRSLKRSANELDAHYRAVAEDRARR